MDLKKIPPGENVPEDIYALIEIPQGSNVKYELNKKSETIFVDRFLFTAMFYPANYGFIPNTLADDGDPIDVLVVSRQPVVPGSVIRCRPVGVLIMEDENGKDEKIIAVPTTKIDPTFKDIKEVFDLPEAMLEQIKHFFEHYKDLEPGKWVKLKEFKPADLAKKMILRAVENYKA